MLVLKREINPTQVHVIYLTKEQHLQGGRLVGYGSDGLGLALWLLGVQQVQSWVKAEPGEPVEQALCAPLWRGWICLQDAEDGKKDS
jgi:hypothetical protein